MKLVAYSLYQPYASAIRWGIKKYETRGKRIVKNLGTTIAIHAALKWTYRERGLLGGFRAMFDPVNKHLVEPLPLGSVVCIADVVKCIPVGEVPYSDMEYHFGDYTSGRWAWELRNVRPLKEPLPWRGNQVPFEVDIPDILILPAI